MFYIIEHYIQFSNVYLTKSTSISLFSTTRIEFHYPFHEFPLNNLFIKIIADVGCMLQLMFL